MEALFLQPFGGGESAGQIDAAAAQHVEHHARFGLLRDGEGIGIFALRNQRFHQMAVDGGFIAHVERGGFLVRVDVFAHPLDAGDGFAETGLGFGVAVQARESDAARIGGAGDEEEFLGGAPYGEGGLGERERIFPAGLIVGDLGEADARVGGEGGALDLIGEGYRGGEFGGSASVILELVEEVAVVVEHIGAGILVVGRGGLPGEFVLLARGFVAVLVGVHHRQLNVDLVEGFGDAVLEFEVERLLRVTLDERGVAEVVVESGEAEEEVAGGQGIAERAGDP